MTRPDWAAGPEWEGFEPHENWCGQTLVVRQYGDGKHFAHIIDGCLAIWGSTDIVYLFNGDSPQEALEKAHAIAAEFGGWA